MSDIAATNCGCGCENNSGCGRSNSLFGGDSCSIIWIILLLSCFCGGNSTFDNGCGGDNSCLWIILLLACCGGGFGC